MKHTVEEDADLSCLDHVSQRVKIEGVLTSIVPYEEGTPETVNTLMEVLCEAIWAQLRSSQEAQLV